MILVESSGVYGGGYGGSVSSLVENTRLRMRAKKAGVDSLLDAIVSE